MFRRYMKLLAPDGAGGGLVAPASDAGSDPQAGPTPNPETPPAGNPNPQAGAGDEPISLEKAKELRGENQSLRTRLHTLERAEEKRQKEEKDASDQKLKEQGDFQKLLETRETELATERATNKALALKYEAVTVATKLGIGKPEKVLKLIDEAAIEYDAAGKPTNLEKLFKAEIEDMPALVDSGGAAHGSGSRPAPSGNNQANSVQAYHDSVYGPPVGATKQ